MPEHIDGKWTRPPRYYAEVINLSGCRKIKVVDPHGYLIGYFDRPEEINDYGAPVDLADVAVVE